MRKTTIWVAMALLFCLRLTAFAGNENGSNSEGCTVKTYTLTELKAIYGENIQVDAALKLDANSLVTMVTMANPCAGTGMQPCGAAEAQARAYARAQANQCCCTFVYGWECCEPGTGAMMAALFLTEPTNCH